MIMSKFHILYAGALAVPVLMVGCSKVETKASHSAILSCEYIGKNSNFSGTFLVMGGRNQKGEDCYNIDKAAIKTFLESPDISKDAAVECKGSPDFEKGVTLGQLYDKGYRLTSISRNQVSVNGVVFPLPGWYYSLEQVSKN